MAIDTAWDKLFQSRDWGVVPAIGTMMLIAAGYHLPKNGIRVLDLGCGCGANLWILAEEGYRVYGIDGSPTAIKKSLDLLDLKAPTRKVDLQVGDLCHLPYEDNFFDAVIDISASSCNPLQDIKKIYDEIFRVLKPTGLVISQMFCAGTDPTCLAEGASAFFAGPDDLNDILSKFVIHYAERRIRAHNGVPNSVIEWLVNSYKPSA